MADQFPIINGGLYHDDCLFYLQQNVSNQKLQRIKYRMVKFFRNLSFSIIFDDDITKPKFWYITLYLYNDSCFPYHKPSTNLKYSSFNNHPKAIRSNF